MSIRLIKDKNRASKATGLAVVIDVFRVFSTRCFIFEQNPKYITPVLTLDEACKINQENPDSILLGEMLGKRNWAKPDGFHLGNSSTDVLNSSSNGINLSQK